MIQKSSFIERPAIYIAYNLTANLSSIILVDDKTNIFYSHQTWFSTKLQLH